MQFNIAHVLSAEGLTSVTVPDEPEEYFHRMHRELARVSFRHNNEASVSASVFAVSSSAIGATTLALPLVAALMGWLLAALTIVVVGVLSAITSNLLIRLTVAENTKSYDSLVRTVLGGPSLAIYQASVVLSSMGNFVVLMILCGDFAQSLSRQFGARTPVNRQLAIVLVSTFAMLPLALLRRIKSLWLVSYLSVVFVAVLAVAVFVEACQKQSSEVSAVDTTILDFSRGFVITALALSSQTNILPVFQEMRGKDVGRGTQLSNTNAIIVTGTYFIVG